MASLPSESKAGLASQCIDIDRSAEIQQLEEIVTASESLKASIEQQLRVLEARCEVKRRELDDAATDLESFKKRLAIAKAACAPISRMPSDILLMIFEAGVVEFECGHCEAKWEDLREPDWDGLLALLRTLTSVSKTWRQLALEFSRLWRSIPVGEPSYTRHIPFQEYLARSRGAPIHVWARPYGRKGVLAMHLQSGDMLRRVRKICVARYKLTVKDVGALFLEIPNLESLSFDFCIFTNLPFPSFMDLVRRFSRLRYLRISVSRIPDEDGTVLPSTETASCPKLDQLHLSLHVLEDVEAISPLISTFQPRHLLLGIYDEAEDNEEESTDSVDTTTVGGVFAFIQELTLVGLRRVEAVRVLLRTPQVRAINFVCGAGTQGECLKLFETLHQLAASKEFLFPELRILSFDYANVSLAAIIKFIEERKRRCPLKTVQLQKSSMSDLFPAQLSELAEIVDVGTWEVPCVTPLGF